MTDSLPSLRAGLTLAEDAIVDTALARRLRLDRSFLAVASALPGSTDDVVARTELEPALVTRIVAALDTHHLLDTEEARTHLREATATQATLAQDPDTVPLIIRDDAAFTCTQCGSCCGGHNIGPVLPDTLEALSPHMAALATKARLIDSPFYSLPSDDEDPSVLCRTQDGWCVFLDDDRKCTIHGALGGPAKPRVCQLFPWEFRATPEGIVVTVSNECRGFAEARQGQPVTERADALRRLLHLIPAGHLGALKPRPALRPGAIISFAQWAEHLETLHDAIDAHPSHPSAALLAMRDALHSRPGPREDPELLDDLESLCAAIRQRLQEVIERSAASSEAVVVRHTGVTLLSEALDAMPLHLRRSLLPLDRRDQGELFTALMHQRLASHELLDATSAVHGLAWLTFGWLVGRASAIHRAQQVKRRHLVSQDLVDATAPITFVLRAGRVRAALRPFDDAVLDLFGRRLGALITLGTASRMNESPLELHAS
ncbi:MAG: YkgJ family cysteine cluster protein [Myxococcota bacterium]